MTYIIGSIAFLGFFSSLLKTNFSLSSESLSFSPNMAFVPAKPYRKEKDGWMAVPQFGGWDQKAGGGAPDYSMVFTRARANRKQQKVNPNSASLGHEKEFLNFPLPRAEESPAMKKWSFFSCLGCGFKN